MARRNYEKGLRLLMGLIVVVFVYYILMTHVHLRELRMKVKNKEYKEAIDENRGNKDHTQLRYNLQTGANPEIYPKRNNMGECYPRYGNITVFVMHAWDSMKTHYGMAQSTLHCYLKGTNYTYISVNTDYDPRTVERCYQNKEINFRKHCAVAVYLEDNPLIDWMLVLDADTAVVNPNHCIEEYIDDRVDVILYERFFNFEIAVGNYLVKNTAYGRQFAMDLANFEFRRPQLPFGNSENGVLHMLVMEKILGETAKPEIDMCNKIWLQSKDYDTYMAFVQCNKMVLGANRFWPGKIRIHRRGHSFVRDGDLTGDRFCEIDFMFHGWKGQNVNISGWESPFSRKLNPSECGQSLSGWPYRHSYNVTVEQSPHGFQDVVAEFVVKDAGQLKDYGNFDLSLVSGRRDTRTLLSEEPRRRQKELVVGEASSKLGLSATRLCFARILYSSENKTYSLNTVTCNALQSIKRKLHLRGSSNIAK